jgi:hypothetical protein
MDASRHPRVRRSAVVMRQRYVEAKYAQAGLERFEARATLALKTALASEYSRQEWVDFDLFVEATELVDALFGHGNLAVAWDIGRFAAEHNIGFWRSVMLRVVSPTVILGMAGSLWSHHYDTGRLVVTPESDGVQVRIIDFLRPHRTHCLSIGGWMERSLELGPSKQVRVREVACRTRGEETCAFVLSWR